MLLAVERRPLACDPSKWSCDESVFLLFSQRSVRAEAGVRRAHQRLHGEEPFQLAAAKLQRQPFTPGEVINGFKRGCGSVAAGCQFLRIAGIQSGVNIPEIVGNKKLHALWFPKSRLKPPVSDNLLLNTAGLCSCRSNH